MLLSEDMALKTPVVILIYNRPELTKQVFNAVRQIKPTDIFIVADGPKDENDLQFCLAARQIFDTCNWPVKVHKNYLEKNIGLGDRIISGLDWVFSQVDQAIILEDDCVPHPTFFRYCEELLSYYKDDERVMYISGNNLGQTIGGSYSYAFTDWTMYWGWATWGRAWQKYNHHLDTWQKHTNKLQKFVSPANRTIFNIITGEIQADRSTWDFPWLTDVWQNDSVGIVPVKNLVKNIGFDNHSHNLSNPSSQFAMLPTKAMEFPLKHPISKDSTASPAMEKAFFELLPETFPALPKIKKSR